MDQITCYFNNFTIVAVHPLLDSATKRSHLTEHIENKHEGLRFPCDQWEYAATSRGNRIKH